MVKYHEYIVIAHSGKRVSFGRFQLPNEAVCRNCGKPIMKVPYGPGLRWVHFKPYDGGNYDLGPACVTTKAEPDRRRRLRNRYAPRGRRTA